MTAEAIAKVLGGRKVGAAWMARCPAHDDREPSLSIADARDGKVLVRCHAGCGQRDVIAALRARGVWGAGERRPARLTRKPNRVQLPETASDAVRRTEAALAIWRASQPAAEIPVETYFRSRGLTIPIPPSIRFHAGLKHPLGAVWPAMVALVTHGADGKPIGIHRTFLTRD
jgi:putative DNA primase/helicase